MSCMVFSEVGIMGGWPLVGALRIHWMSGLAELQGRGLFIPRAN